MRPSELLKNNRDEILALAAKAGAENVRVFGSESEKSSIFTTSELLGGALADRTSA